MLYSSSGIASVTSHKDVINQSHPSRTQVTAEKMAYSKDKMAAGISSFFPAFS
jgi:hypothetical protein